MSRPRSVLWMEIDEWKTKMNSDTPLGDGYCLQKVETDIHPKAVEGIDRTIRFVVSRSTVDRDNDTIKQEGWILDSFLKNPVVPFAHDYRALPVAKSISTNVIGGELIGTAQFASRDEYVFADTVYQMLLGGFLNAVSVGFRPRAHEMNKERGGVDFIEQELLEYSIVPVPSNPDALVQARSFGIDTDPLKVWAEKTLDEWHQEEGLWLPKKIVEDMHWSLSGKAVPVALETETKDADDETKTAEELGGELHIHMDVSIPDDTLKTAAELAQERVSEQESDPPTLEPEPYTLDLADGEMLLELDDEIVPSTEEPAWKGDGMKWSPEVQALTDLVQDTFGSTVQKLDPVILGNPLPGSYEDITVKLVEQIPNYLTRNGKAYRPDHDRPFMISTFNDRAVFCIIGHDRPFSEDPCYKGTFVMNEELGVPQWTGEPTEIDIVVNVSLIEQSAVLLNWKDKETVDGVDTAKHNGHLEFTTEDLKSSVEEVLQGSLRSIGEVVKNQTEEAIRKARGRLD